MAAIIERLQAAMQACQGQDALGSQAESAAEADGQGASDDAAAAELDESAAAAGEDNAALAELASGPGPDEDDPAGRPACTGFWKGICLSRPTVFTVNRVRSCLRGAAMPNLLTGCWLVTAHLHLPLSTLHSQHRQYGTPNSGHDSWQQPSVDH